MKKLYYLILLSSLFSMIFLSCNKEESSSPTSGNTNTGPITKIYSSNPNITIVPNGLTSDSLNAIITDVNSNNVTDIKLDLISLEGVTISDLQFYLIHNGTEVFAIDRLTNISGSGNISNLVLSDSAPNSIMTVNSYPITGVYKPLNQLSGFNNMEASGYWTLWVYNYGTLRTGVIKSWGITLTYRVQSTATLQILPTAVGNIWIMERRDALGNFIRNDSLSIPYSTTFQSKTVYRWYMSTNNDTILIGNESNGLWMYSIPNNSSQLMWKYPVNSSEWWIGGPNNIDTIRCLSTNETVITPLGTYTACIKYQQSDRYNSLPAIGFAFVKPGIGLISYELYDNNSVFRENMKLIYYSLHK